MKNPFFGQTTSMKKYSDLLIEATNMESVLSNTKKINNVDISESIVNKEISTIINRKVGKYITLFPTSKNTDGELITALFSSLIKLKEYYRIDLKKTLVVGLGNDQYVVDSLGDSVVEKIKTKEDELLAFSPKVYTQTGIKSCAMIKAITSETHPDLVIVVDSIATNSKSRLSNCYQLTTAGLCPGGGISQNKNYIDSTYLSTPIIAIGVPVILSSPYGFITPYNIEDIIRSTSLIIAHAINKFGQ